MKTSRKRFWTSLIAFAAVGCTTIALLRYVSPAQQYVALGVFGILFAFVTAMVVTLPVDHFRARYREGARLAKIISVSLLTLTAALFLFFFFFVLLVRSGVQRQLLN